MNKEFLTEFIEVYRQHPALWKVKSKEYVNKNLKIAAYNSLIEVCCKYNITADKGMVSKKIQSLRSAFRKEYRKIESSIRSGKGADETYRSTLWYYDLLLFTRDQDEPTESLSNLVVDSSLDEGEGEENANTEEADMEDHTEKEGEHASSVSEFKFLLIS